MTVVLRNSSDLIDKVSRWPVNENTIFVKGDIAVFFMSGDHRVLIAQSSSLVPGGMREHFRDMLFLLLHPLWHIYQRHRLNIHDHLATIQIHLYNLCNHL